MPSVQIKNVPESTHRVLTERAAAAHQSLQEYLLAKLVADAERPTVAEVLTRAASHRGGDAPLADVVALVRADRDRRSDRDRR